MSTASESIHVLHVDDGLSYPSWAAESLHRHGSPAVLPKLEGTDPENSSDETTQETVDEAIDEQNNGTVVASCHTHRPISIESAHDPTCDKKPH